MALSDRNRALMEREWTDGDPLDWINDTTRFEFVVGTLNRLLDAARSEGRAEAEERVKGLRDALERLVKPAPGVKMLPPWAVGIARAALQQHSDGGER